MTYANAVRKQNTSVINNRQHEKVEEEGSSTKYVLKNVQGNIPSDINGHGNAVIAAITDVKTVRVDKGQNKLPSRGTRRTVRRGIGCLGMKVAVEEKLQRIMLIRSNKQEANAAAHNKMPSPLIHQELKSISKK